VRILLVPVGTVAQPVMEWLLHGLPGALPVRPALHPGLDDDWDGGPVSASAVVDGLLGLGGVCLGATERTLLSDQGEPVFGQAAVSGPAAVISIAALRGADPLMLKHRVLATAAHELGHMAGAEHCADPQCVMYPSRCLRDTDRKRLVPCGSCAKTIESLLARGA
jgi:predicted Zn-dependent protease